MKTFNTIVTIIGVCAVVLITACSKSNSPTSSSTQTQTNTIPSTAKVVQNGYQWTLDSVHIGPYPSDGVMFYSGRNYFGISNMPQGTGSYPATATPGTWVAQYSGMTDTTWFQGTVNITSTSPLHGNDSITFTYYDMPSPYTTILATW